MLTKFRAIGLTLLVLTALLAACAPAQTQAANASDIQIQVPVTAATATSISAAAPADAQASTATPAAVSGNTAPSAGITFSLVPSKSEASYQVREQLARLNFPSDAIGKTSAVSGSITLKPDGSVDAANSKFTVDVSTLQTDSAMRDGYVARNILQSDRFPQVVFAPTQVTGLPASLPQSGPVSFQITGNLTIRDVTKPVTWDVTGTVNNGEGVGAATTSFTFEDFNLNQPQVPVVLSVVDKITLNLTLDIKTTRPNG